MPNYNLKCSSKKCGENFDAICSFKEYDVKFINTKCPKCSKNKPTVNTDLKHAPWFLNSPDKMNNFEYAAKKNFSKAEDESRNAKEEAVKRGIKSPYSDLPDITDNGKKMNFIE